MQHGTDMMLQKCNVREVAKQTAKSKPDAGPQAGGPQPGAALPYS